MQLSQALRLFAIAALVANATTAMVLVALVRRRKSPLSTRWIVGTTALIATAAALGSLYLSEIAHLEPCRWCWFQRIAMYPLALVLVVGWARRDRSVHWYALPMCLAGAAMSTWHYLLQLFPSLEAGTTCSLTSPCNVRYAWEFGFVSIPYMAGSVFVLVAVLLCWSLRRSKRPRQDSNLRRTV